MIRFACPGCSSTFTVADEKAGKTGKCPKCHIQFTIPQRYDAESDQPPPMTTVEAPPPIPTVDAPPRAGDPAVLVAKVDRAANVLGWRATRTELARIVSDAWAFMEGDPFPAKELGVTAKGR